MRLDASFHFHFKICQSIQEKLQYNLANISLVNKMSSLIYFINVCYVEMLVLTCSLHQKFLPLFGLMILLSSKNMERAIDTESSPRAVDIYGNSIK